MDRRIAIGDFAVRANETEADGRCGRCVSAFKTSWANPRKVAKPEAVEVIVLLRRLSSRCVSAQAGRWEKLTRGYLYLICRVIYPPSRMAKCGNGAGI
jgi:D-3-phosphoglycerate dehydrogenase / 2-oxoglutarate reductase